MTTATTGVHPALEPLRLPACDGPTGFHDFCSRGVTDAETVNAPVAADSGAVLGRGPAVTISRVRGGTVVSRKRKIPAHRCVVCFASFKPYHVDCPKCGFPTPEAGE